MGKASDEASSWRAGSSVRLAAWLAIDQILEASVVGSFTAAGIRMRRRVGRGVGAFGPLPSQAGRTVLVTGATSGIGLEVARGFAGLGAHVHLVGRDLERAERARELVAAAGDPAAQVHLVDLSDPGAVRSLAGQILSRHDSLDALVHAAGNILPSFQLGPGGVEATLAVHVLAPFLLVEMLIPALAKARPRPGGDRGRVVIVTSGGMYTQRFNLANLQATRSDYRGTVAYARAKRAQMVLTWAFAQQLEAIGATAHAVHPGWVDTPGLRSGLPGFARRLGPWLRRPDEGAEGVIWVATAPGPAKRSGELWFDHRPRSVHRLPWTWTRTSRWYQAQTLLNWCASQPGWSPQRHWAQAS